LFELIRVMKFFALFRSLTGLRVPEQVRSVMGKDNERASMADTGMTRNIVAYSIPLFSLAFPIASFLFDGSPLIEIGSSGPVHRGGLCMRLP